MPVADGAMSKEDHVTKKVKTSKSRKRDSEVEASHDVKPSPVIEKTAQAKSVGAEVSTTKKAKKEGRKRKARSLEEAANEVVQVENAGPDAASLEPVQSRAEKRSKKDHSRRKRRKDGDGAMESQGEPIAAAEPASAADSFNPEIYRVNGNGSRDGELNGIAGTGKTKGGNASIPTTWEQVGLPEPVQPAKKRKHEQVADTTATPKKQKKSERKKQKLVEPREEHEELPRPEEWGERIMISEVENVIEAEETEQKAKSNGEANVDDAEETSSGPKDPADPTLREKLKPKKSRTKSAPESETNIDTSANNANPTNETPSTTAPHQRFIAFIGNLPFTATTAQIKSHFSSVNPTSIRHITVKDDPKGKSKGYAFLEFDNYDRMKTCLKLYHHSAFPVIGGKGGRTVPGEEGKVRRINVELTVGGGGSKSVLRKEKLQAKNERLAEQRRRRAEAEEAQGMRKAKKDKGKGGQNAAPAENGTAVVGVDGADEQKKGAGEGAQSAKDNNAAGEMGDMHPSRRARMR